MVPREMSRVSRDAGGAVSKVARVWQFADAGFDRAGFGFGCNQIDHPYIARIGHGPKFLGVAVNGIDSISIGVDDQFEWILIGVKSSDFNPTGQIDVVFRVIFILDGIRIGDDATVSVVDCLLHDPTIFGIDRNFANR